MQYNKKNITSFSKFTFDGELLGENNTCYLYGIEDGDLIDVL